MRKILVVLLVLSVLGGAFADWWSLSGSAIMGTRVDFDAEDATINRDSSLNDCCCAGENTAKFGISYGTNDGLSASIDFDLTGNIYTSFGYSGDNYYFTAGADLWALLGGVFVFHSTPSWGGINDPWDDDAVLELSGDFGGDGWFWGLDLGGWYKFFDGMIHLEAHLAGPYEAWWLSDETVGDLFGANLGMADFAGGSGVLVNFSFEALDFGLFVPDVFNDENRLLVGDGDGELGIFEEVAIGFLFNMDPIEFAAVFGVENYTAYFGARIFMGALTLGMSFQGEFEEEALAHLGLSANFDGGVFGAGIQAGYKLDTADEDAWEIAIAPNFWYNVIPDYMRFVLDAKFVFNTDDVLWEFFPAVIWNFKGTGNASRIGTWSAATTGLGVGYKLAGGNDEETANELYVGFAWSF
ncbi:MAG: hypothetical protein FWD24_02415 [Treponema sp.]|nr:hypothetical protein [Treponema sp.]